MLPKLPSPLMSSMMLMGAGSSGPGTVPFVGPFDAYSDGLIDAFSAEYRLLSSYKGGLFLARAEIGGEATIGVDAAGRFDMDAWNALVPAGYGFGVHWLNQVAGGNNWVQESDATKQGQIIPNEIGGGAVLALDEVNDGYDSIRTLNRPFTVYLVEYGVANGTELLPVGNRTLQSSTANSVLSTARVTDNTAFINGAGVSAAFVSGQAITACLVAPSGAGASYFLGGVEHTDYPGNTNNWGTLLLGVGAGAVAASEPAHAKVCELLIYNVAHDEATRTAITAVLNGLRGIS